MLKSNSQAGQDLFVTNVLKNKKNGIFVEIGSFEPIYLSNSYMLEKELDWTGIMFDWTDFSKQYDQHRFDSIYKIGDVTKVNFNDLFKNTLLKNNANFPKNIDYLQIDLHVCNRSTLNVLENINNQVMDEYKFATVTFEHDIYTGNHFDTREKSREIFNNRGYIRVFSDVMDNNCKFEDWYVHPDLVDMEYVNKIKSDESMDWKDIIKRF